MRDELKIGNVANIINALRQAGAVLKSEDRSGTVHRYFEIGDDSEVQAIMAEMNAKREKLLDASSRDRLLCDAQVRCYGLGWVPASLGTNIYGFAVGSSLRSNIGGGRWSMTGRGLSLEEAVVWACEFVKDRKNHTVTLGASHFPAEVVEAFSA